MPLHGKIVVIKRSGGDGTEFPLTATCLFGRKPDCDIRIQLPQVSKEHCRIDLNENKEIILTNLSTANPTRVNGEALQQSERLKHGDVITIIDRSFRFEYPPAPTPKKGSIKTETLKVLQDQQVGDTVTAESGEKRISEVSTDPLKDGTNHHNIQRSLDKTVEVTEDDGLLQSKTASPFNDLYQMIKKSLDVKTPRKSSASVLQTPTSRFCTPKSVRKNDGKPVVSTEDKVTPKKDEAKISPVADETKGEAENANNETPKSVKKQRRSSQLPSADMAEPEAEATSPQRRVRTPPQRFTAGEVTPKSPVRRRSKETTPAVTKEQEQAATSPKMDQTASPRNSRKADKETSRKRRSEELGADLPTQQSKKKRVSFGGFLCPELFDKRLPPDSPLRKGAAPRRSYLSKPKESLLRRASVIGLMESKNEGEASPKMRAQSPKSRNASPKTQTSGKMSPKSRSPSPKAATPTKASPKSRSSSPKAATPAKTPPRSRSSSPKAATPAKTPPRSRSVSPKAATPAKTSPKSRSSSPKAATPAKTPPRSRSSSPKAATPAKTSPKSRSSSPKAATPAKTSPKSRSISPKAATPAKTSPKSKSPSPARRSSTVQTPKVQGRFSVSLIGTPSPVAEDAAAHQVPLVPVTPKVSQRRKSISRETPSKTKSAAKLMQRRSGISRASMRVKNSWADIVRFGKTKAQVVAPAKQTATKKTSKKTVTKPQTPARKVKSLVSTGHADSPATIVVGRAHKLKLVHPTGAAPKLVTNMALFKKSMKMDEDLTGISEMLKTPVNDRKRKSVVHGLKTPVGTSVVDPSVLNTPEEPGEMMVSPLSVSSTLKDKSYNNEAVQRLLNDDEERSFVSDTPALETQADESSEQQSTDLKTTSVKTPKQKPEKPDCLTGVKRVMKTPRQKSEPIEDLRGKILKTPKQKAEQQECLTGVKRIMKTPRQKSEPIEDLRGKILKTPKQKPEQQECLTGVKRIMKTPRQKSEPIEDLRGKILKTPKQKPEQQECLTGVKRMMETPRQEAESVDDIKVELLKTPTQKPEQEECLANLNSICKTPQQEAGPLEDLPEKSMEAPEALEAGEAEEPVEKPAPTQESSNLSVEENFGIKELVATPKLTCKAPVEDSVGHEELMVETMAEPTGQQETNEVADQMSPDCDEDVAKELDLTHEEPRHDETDVDTEEADANQIEDGDHLVELASGHDITESSDVVEILSMSQATVDEKLSEEPPKEEAADEKLSEEPPKEEAADEELSEEPPKEDAAVGAVTDVDTAASDLVHEKKPVRGRRARTVECKPAVGEEEAAEHCEEPVVSAPVRGRRGKKTEATAPPAVRKTTRGRNAKSQENTCDDHPGVEAEKPVETEIPAEAVTEQTSPVKENNSAEEAVVKPVRGRKPKQTPVEPLQPEKQEVVSDEPLPDDAQSEKPITTLGRSKRGRKTKPDTTEQTEVTEEAAVAVETMQQPQPPVRAKRGRNAKLEGEKHECTSVETTESQEPAKKTRRTRKVEQDQAPEDPAETEVVAEPQSEQSSSVDVEHEANDSAAPLEKAVPKPKRGRRAKQTEQPDVASSHSDNVPQEDMPKEAADPLEVEPSGSDENESSDATETVPQAPVTESPPEVETATCKVTEMEATVVQKKPVRGRRARTVECKPAVDEEEAAEHCEEPVVSAPVRGRRGKKTEATAPPAVRKTTRGRNAKSQENTCDDQPEVEAEKPVETEIPAEAVTEQTSPVKENNSAEEAVVKPVRGRKPKQTPVEPLQPEKQEVVSDEPLPDDAQPEKPITTLGRSKRGRKTKPDTTEQTEVTEEAAVAVETMQQPQPSVRAKRGRNAKLEEEKPESASVETTESQEPAKKTRRTRKVEQDHVEPREEEVQAVEAVVPEEAEAPLVAEPVEMNEPATVAPKSRRGRKAKQEPECETPEEEVPAVSSTDKLKRGRRGKEVTEEAAVTVTEEKPDHEKDDAEPDAPVIKQSRARGVKTAVKNDVSIPAKRARRGAALPVEETNEESTVLVSEPEPAKRGRRAAAKPTADEATVTSDQANPSEDLNDAAEEHKASKKSVKWKADPEVFEVSTATPVRAARGRKSSKNVSKDAEKTEEKDLSEEVVEALPVKRARRGAKVADEAESTSMGKTEADAQPRTRRGRPAKK